MAQEKQLSPQQVEMMQEGFASMAALGQRMAGVLGSAGKNAEKMYDWTSKTQTSLVEATETADELVEVFKVTTDKTIKLEQKIGDVDAAIAQVQGNFTAVGQAIDFATKKMQETEAAAAASREAIRTAEDKLRVAEEKVARKQLEVARANDMSRTLQDQLRIEESQYNIKMSMGRLSVDEAKAQRLKMDRMRSEISLYNKIAGDKTSEYRNALSVAILTKKETDAVIVRENRRLTLLDSLLTKQKENLKNLETQKQEEIDGLVKKKEILEKILNLEQNRQVLETAGIRAAQTYGILVKGTWNSIAGQSGEWKKTQELIGAAGKAARALAGDPTAIAEFALKIADAAISRFEELDAAAERFRRTTRLLVTQTKAIDKAVREVNVDLQYLGVGIEEGYRAASELYKAFGTSALVSKELIKDTAMMAANLGISEENLAKFNSMFGLSAKKAGMTAMDTAKAATALANMAGVAPNEVMQDMADASKETLMFLSKSPMQLVRAAVEARRLGTTVNSLAASAKQMLNFQDSITSELEASALLGKALNFQAARQAAYEGDVVRSRELAMKQIEKAGDFTKLNVYQQEALAKAAGMTVEEVTKQQNQQKMLAELKNSANAEDRKAYAEYEAMSKRLKEDEKAASKNLLVKGREMAKQQLQQAQMTKITNAFKSIWNDITDALLPIANAIMPLIISAAMILGKVFKVVGGIIRALLLPLQHVIDFISGAVDKVKEMANEGGILGSVFSKIGWVFDKLTWFVSTFGEAILYVVGAATMAVLVFSGGLKTLVVGVWNAVSSFVSGLIPSFVGAGSAAGAAGSSLMSGLVTPIMTAGKTAWDTSKKFVKDLIPGLDGMANKAWDAAKSFLSGLIPALSSGAKSVWKAASSFFSGLIPALISGAGSAWTAAKSFFSGLIPALGAGATSVWTTVTSFLSGLIPAMASGAASVWKTVVSFVSGLIPSLSAGASSALTTAGSFISGLIPAMLSGAASVWTTVTSFLSGLVPAMLSGAASVWTTVTSFLTGLIPALLTAAASVWGTVTSFLSGLIPAMIAGASAVWGAAVSFFSGLIPAAIAGAAALWTMLAPIAPIILAVMGIVAAVYLLKDVFADLDFGEILDSILAPFTGAWDALKEIFSGDGDRGIGEMIVDTLKVVGKLALDLILWPYTTAVNFIGKLFGFDNLGSDILDGIKEGASKVFDILTWPFRTVYNFIGNLFFGDSDESIMERILGSIMSLGSAVLDALIAPFKKAWEWIKGIFGDIGGLIMGGLSAIGGAVLGAVTAPFKAAWEGAKMIGGAISSTFEAAGELASGAIDWVSDTAAEAWDSIQEVGAGVWDGITSFGASAWDSISNFGSSVWEGMEVLGSSVWDTMADAGTEAWDYINEFGSNVWDTMTDLGASAWDGVVDFGTSAWDKIQEAGEDVWNGVTEVGSSAWDKMQELGEDAMDVGSNAWDAMTDVGAEVWDDIIDFGTSAWDTIADAGEAAWERVSEFGASAWNKIQEVSGNVVDFGSSTWDDMVEASADAWEEVVDFGSSAWDSIQEAGEAAWEGILDGGSMLWENMEVAGSALWESMKSAASDVWDNIESVATLANDMFGGSFDISGQIVDQIVMALETTVLTVVIDNMNELTDSIDGLTDAILTLGEQIAERSDSEEETTGNQAVVDKLDELIGLLQDGAIGVKIDGIAASRALARSST